MRPLEFTRLSPLEVLSTTPDLPAVSKVAFNVALTVLTWEVRHRTRKQLLQMTEEQLKDIGIDRAAAITEASRWFWQS